MLVNTTRFGQITITEDDLLTFPEGLLGFSDCRKFVLLDDPNDEIFAWMQSCEDPDIAFPVLEPELILVGCQFALPKNDMEKLGVSEKSSVRSFLIITIPDDPTQMTANFKAPIFINVAQRVGRQCVLQDNNLAIREPIFTRLQQRIVQNPDKGVKSPVADIGVTIPLDNFGPIKGGPVVES